MKKVIHIRLDKGFKEEILTVMGTELIDKETKFCRHKVHEGYNNSFFLRILRLGLNEVIKEIEIKRQEIEDETRNSNKKKNP